MREKETTRQFWINLRLHVVAFFTPVLLIIVISGGLYLIGTKGTTVETHITLPANATLNLGAGDLKEAVDGLLRAAGIKRGFEFIKGDGSTLTTPSTSPTYYVLEMTEDGVRATHVKPDRSGSRTDCELRAGLSPLRPDFS